MKTESSQLLRGDVTQELFELDEPGEGGGTTIGSSLSFIRCQYSSPYDWTKEAVSDCEEQCASSPLYPHNPHVFCVVVVDVLDGYKLITPRGRGVPF